MHIIWGWSVINIVEDGRTFAAAKREAPPCLGCAPRPRLTAGGARARQRMGPHNPSPDPTPKHAAHAATLHLNVPFTMHSDSHRSGAEESR